MVAEFELARDLGERAFAHDPGPQTGQIAFRHFGSRSVKQFCNHHVENRIAEEFEPLVVGMAAAAMTQRQIKQCRLGEAAAKRVLQSPILRLS